MPKTRTNEGPAPSTARCHSPQPGPFKKNTRFSRTLGINRCKRYSLTHSRLKQVSRGFRLQSDQLYNHCSAHDRRIHSGAVQHYGNSQKGATLFLQGRVVQAFKNICINLLLGFIPKIKSSQTEIRIPATATLEYCAHVSYEWLPRLLVITGSM